MGRSEYNVPLLKLVSPNSLMMGRISTRIPTGPFKLPTGPTGLMQRVQDLYASWFAIFNDALLPNLISSQQPKWYVHDQDLKPGDVALFRKDSGLLAGPWVMGMVDEVVKGRDGLVREVGIRYTTSSESVPRLTTRAVRSVVRLFNIDELDWRDEMNTVRKIVEDTHLNLAPNEMKDTLPAHSTDQILTCSCCCASHHVFCSASSIPPLPQLIQDSPAPCTSILAIEYPVEDTTLDAGRDLQEFEDADTLVDFLACVTTLGTDLGHGIPR